MNMGQHLSLKSLENLPLNIVDGALQTNLLCLHMFKDAEIHIRAFFKKEGFRPNVTYLF